MTWKYIVVTKMEETYVSSFGNSCKFPFQSRTRIWYRLKAYFIFLLCGSPILIFHPISSPNVAHWEIVEMTSKLHPILSHYDSMCVALRREKALQQIQFYRTLILYFVFNQLTSVHRTPVTWTPCVRISQQPTVAHAKPDFLATE